MTACCRYVPEQDVDAVVCATCHDAEPAHGYDYCAECFAAYLHANPEERVEFERVTAGMELDADDRAILAALSRADSSGRGAALDAGESLSLAAGVAPKAVFVSAVQQMAAQLRRRFM